MDIQDKKVARIVAVSGSQVVALIDPQPSADKVLDGPKSTMELQIGGLVKMQTSQATVYGMICSLNVPMPEIDGNAKEVMLAELELIGEAGLADHDGRRIYRRGVSQMPGLGNDVLASTKDDLELVYARPNANNIMIGTVHQDQSVPAYVMMDDLLGKHFAILGTTGSGKSCAVATIMHAIFAECPNSHVLMLDPHNEYTHAFGDIAEVLGPDTLQLPYWLLKLDELVGVLAGEDADQWQAEVAVLRELIPQAKRQFTGRADGEENDVVTVDTPVPYHIGELLRLIEDAMGKLELAEGLAPYLRLKSRLTTLRSDHRFSFMFGSRLIRDNMNAILGRLFRMPVNGKPVTIVDLSGVPSEVLNVVVSLLSRMTFDLGFLSDGKLPIMLVCEEAHRYAPQNPKLGFGPTTRSLSRIAKEGRKYGVSLCVVTQRPSELAPDILSQCNTVFALRLSNHLDQACITSALADSSRGLLDSLPALGNAEAILIGEGISVPVRVQMARLPEEKRPRSGSASFATAWREDQSSTEFINEIIARWRRAT